MKELSFKSGELTYRDQFANSILMKIIILGILTAFGLIASCDQKTEQQRSEIKIENRVFDHASLLTTDQEDTIFHFIKSLDHNIGSQLAVVTIDTLKGESIQQYSLKMAGKLKLGRAGFDDGILISVVVKERKMRIEVGYGLEKIIRDEIAATIIREDMAPSFRKQDYAGGLTKAIGRIIQLIEENEELVGQKP